MHFNIWHLSFLNPGTRWENICSILLGSRPIFNPSYTLRIHGRALVGTIRGVLGMVIGEYVSCRLQRDWGYFVANFNMLRLGGYNNDPGITLATHERFPCWWIFVRMRLTPKDSVIVRRGVIGSFESAGRRHCHTNNGRHCPVKPGPQITLIDCESIRIIGVTLPQSDLWGTLFFTFFFYSRRFPELHPPNSNASSSPGKALDRWSHLGLEFWGKTSRNELWGFSSIRLA